MIETTLVLENSCDDLTSTEETPSASDYDARVAADATPRAYSALTERPAGFRDIFAPKRRQCIEAAATYQALSEPPADFIRKDFFAPRDRPAEQAVPTYRALTRPLADFAEIPVSPEIQVVPEIQVALTNQSAEQTVSSGKPFSTPVVA